MTISQRAGMLKTYELMNRHFGWERLPRRGIRTRDARAILLDRALRSQGIVSVESACYLDAPRKPAMRTADRSAGAPRGAGARRAREAREDGSTGRGPRRSTALPSRAEGLVHILSPFDPLINQRKRLHLFFDYEHRFEAYVPKDKRVFGYFACPCWWATRSSPPSISRPIASGRSC